MSDAPAFRARSESGDVVDNPSDGALFELFAKLEAGDGTFFIVEALSDPSGQTYAQTMRDDDGTYVVEFREGDATRHFATDAADFRAACALIAGWTFQVPGWRECVPWRQVTFE